MYSAPQRWRAHCLRDQGQLEEPTILAHVRKATDEEIAIDAIIENLARADITPMEEARAWSLPDQLRTRKRVAW